MCIQVQTNSTNMMFRRTAQTLVTGLLCFLMLAPNLANAEGTKQTTATSSDRTHLLTNYQEYNYFARYNGTIDQRLFIHIENPETEVVYFGFSQFYDEPHWPQDGDPIDGYFRIKDPSGNVVWPTTGNNGQLNNAAIAGWSQAVNGPNQIVGSGGYNAYTFNPDGLPAGDYYIEFSANQGSFSSQELVIPYYDITVATEGGPYLWSNSDTTMSIAVTDAGTYFVQATDPQTGCVGVSEDVVVDFFAEFIPEIEADGPTAFCDGDSVTLTVAEGEFFLWSTTQTTQSITVGETGVYTVLVTDTNGCTAEASITVTVLPSAPTSVVPDFDFPYCEGDVVTLTALGVPFIDSFEWNTGETTQSIQVTESLVYTVEVTNPFGCISTASLPILFLPTPSAEVSLDGPASICDGDELTLTANAPPFINTFEWSTSETGQSITVSEAGTYSVTVTSISGCSATSDPITIDVVPGPTAEITGDTGACVGDTLVLSAMEGDNYLWSTGETTASITVFVTESGDYSVEVTNDGCNQVAIGVISIEVQEYPWASFGFDHTNLGHPIEFADSSLGDGIVSWNWDFDDGNASMEQNPIHDYEEPGQYAVTLNVSTSAGCSDDTTQILPVEEFFIITNVLTPNGDDINDYVWITSSLAETIEAKVFNRWGLSVWEGVGNDLRFSGKTSEGADLDGGTYYYILSLNYGEAGVKELTGYITLIRQ